jgi:hypothetical protein
VAPEAVETGRENGNDGEEVVEEFLLGGCLWLMENHDLPMGVLRDEFLEQVKTESTQSIFVGNHNFSEMTLDRGVQKGLKPFSLEVEA